MLLTFTDSRPEYLTRILGSCTPSQVGSCDHERGVAAGEEEKDKDMIHGDGFDHRVCQEAS